MQHTLGRCPHPPSFRGTIQAVHTWKYQFGMPGEPGANQCCQILGTGSFSEEHQYYRIPRFDTGRQMTAHTLSWMKISFVRNSFKIQSYFAVETKSFSSPPPSSKASNVLASPVDCRPMTTHWRTNECHCHCDWALSWFCLNFCSLDTMNHKAWLKLFVLYAKIIKLIALQLR